MAVVRERSLIDRMIGVAKLDAATFEEIEHDETATIPALIIAALAGVSVGVGVTLLGTALGEVSGLGAYVFFATSYVIAGMIALVFFTTVAYVVGGKLLRVETTEVTWVELLRTLGFAGVPLMVAGWVSFLNPLILAAVAGWFLAAVVVAVRQAADTDTGRAIGTALVGLVTLLLIYFVLFAITPPM